MDRTASEICSDALRFYSNMGSPQYATDRNKRAQAERFLNEVADEAWSKAPVEQRFQDFSISLTAGVGTVPAGFAGDGQKAIVYISGQPQVQVHYRAPSVVLALLQSQPQTSSYATYYCLHGQTALGLQQVITWPTVTGTMLVKEAPRKVPAMVDCPCPPEVVLDTGGVVTAGNHRVCVTFERAIADLVSGTDGGFESAVVLSTGTSKVLLTDVPVSPHREILARAVWMTKVLSAGVNQAAPFYHVGYITDNITTTYTANVADASLTVQLRTPAQAITGPEQFPSNAIDSILFRGLVFRLAGSYGDLRGDAFRQEWERAVTRYWAENAGGRNEVHRFVPFPGGPRGGRGGGFDRGRLRGIIS